MLPRWRLVYGALSDSIESALPFDPFSSYPGVIFESGTTRSFWQTLTIPSETAFALD